MFEIILSCFLSGESTSQAGEVIAEKLKIDPPTVKTIGRHYDRIGLALFDRTYGAEWHIKHPYLNDLKIADPAEHDLAIDKLADAYHFEALNPLEPEYAQPVKPGERPWGESIEAREYRTFSAMRFGIRYRSRGHLALARFRAEYHSEVKTGKGLKILVLTNEDLKLLEEDIKKMFRTNPC